MLINEIQQASLLQAKLHVDNTIPSPSILSLIGGRVRSQMVDFLSLRQFLFWASTVQYKWVQSTHPKRAVSVRIGGIRLACP